MAFGDKHRRAFLILVPLILTMGLAHGITLEAFPKTLNRSGDNVTLQWKDFPSPSDMDWLGIYSPPDSPHDHFIGYILLSSCPTWKEGSCSMNLPLINLRSPYEFRVFHLDEKEIGKRSRDHNHPPSDGHLVAKSDTVTFLNLNDPAQLHLAFTSNEDEMRVMFVTKDNIKSYARYGVEKGKLDNVAEAHSLTYKQSDMCDSPANSTLGWREPGHIHDAVMDGLKPGKRYFYQVGSDEGGWSSIQSFLSPDKNSDETFAFVFGDMGTSFPYRTFRLTQIESKLTVKWLLRDLEELGDKPAFISHIGDLSYARGYAWLWDSFLSQIEPIASKFPYHVCIGNHEYDWPLQPWKPSWASYAYGKDGGGECGVPYSLRFQMPGNSSSSTGNASPVTQNLFYSFDMGVVHFVYISTETNFLQGSDQYAFIEHDLGHVDRSKTPFVVVQGHRPMYTTSDRKGDDAIRQKMVEHLEPLFVEFGVNLVLWGHVHSYERLCPLRNSSCGSMDAEGILPIHVVVGMAGAESRPSWKPRSDHLTDPIYPQPPMSIYRSDEFGYTRMHATRSRLTLSFVGNHDGLVHDVLEIHLKETHLKDFGTAFIAWVSFLKAVCLFLVGALLGFIGGYLLYFRRQSPGKVQWTTLSNSEL